MLGLTASSALLMLFIEVMGLKLAFYLLSVQSAVPFLDLVSLCGYKFVGLVLTMLVALPIGLLYYPMVLYTGMAMGYFVVRLSHEPQPSTERGHIQVQTLRLLVLPENITISNNKSSGAIKYLLIFVGLLQIGLSYILSVAPD